MKKILAAIVLPLVLVACADTPPPAVKVETDMGPKINLDVLSVVVLDRTEPLGGRSLYNTNDFQPTIATAVREWATDKLVATGSTGQAIVVIRDASLKYEVLPHKDDMFTREQASKYIGHAAVEIDVTGREGHGQVSADASRFATLPEEPSALERKNAYAKMLNGLTADLAAKLRVGIKDHIGSYVITAPILPQ